MNIEIILIALVVIIVMQSLLTVFERQRNALLIDRLTDKIMSRDYSDYLTGQVLKDDRLGEEATSQTRNDTTEAWIEQKNREAEDLERKAKTLEAKLTETM